MESEVLAVERNRRESGEGITVSSSRKGGEGMSSNYYSRREIYGEMKRQLWLSAPLVALNLIHYSIQVSSIMLVSRLGNLAFSAASIATSFASLSGYSVLMGMGGALDMLCGQAYGAQRYKLLSTYTQSAMVVLLLMCIPIGIMWAYMTHILILIGLKREISIHAGIYVRWMIPSLFAYSLFQCQSKFLKSQNNVFPLTVATGITAGLHVLLCWLLVTKSGLGLNGAALANTISYWVVVVLLELYVQFSPTCKKTWTGFSRDAFHEVFKFVKVAVPSAGMICLEFWSFQVLIILSALLPNPELEMSVLSISLSTYIMVYKIPSGLAGAISTRVSNELGAGNPETARLAVCVVLIIVFVEEVILTTVTILVRRVWAYSYSKEEEVVKYVAALMPLLAISNFIDGIEVVLSGIAGGCGKQKNCAFFNLGAFFVVGIPIGSVLAFVFHVGLKGLWIGITCAIFIKLPVLIKITLFTSWEEQARKAKDRIYSFSASIEKRSSSNTAV